MNKPRVCIVVDDSVLQRHHGVRRYLLAMVAALRSAFDIEVYSVAVRLSSQDVGFTRLYYDRNFETNNGFGGCRLAGRGRQNILDRLPDIVREDHRPSDSGGMNSIFVGDRIPGEFDLGLFGAPWVYTAGMPLPTAKRTFLMAYDAIPSFASVRLPANDELGVFAYHHIYAFKEFTEKHDGILAISQDSVEQCRKVLLDPKAKVLAIPPFLPAGFEDLPDQSPAQKIPGRVLLAAPFDPRKGLAAMPAILRDSGATSLAIFGGVRCAEANVRDFLSAVDIDDIEWWSEVDYAKQLEMYRSASVLLFPSLQEGLGLPVLEAYACGTAAIVSDISPLNGLVLPSGLLPGQADAGSGLLRRHLSEPPNPGIYQAHARTKWGKEVLIRFISGLLPDCSPSD